MRGELLNKKFRVINQSICASTTLLLPPEHPAIINLTNLDLSCKGEILLLKQTHFCSVN